MGGSVRVVIRRASGEVISQVRWTNPMPDRIFNFDFLLDKDGAVDKYISSAPPEDADDKDVAPVGYGLVFVDFKEKKIFSMQGYCSFTCVYGVSLCYDLQNENTYEFSAQKRLRAFWEHDPEMVKCKKYEVGEIEIPPAVLEAIKGVVLLENAYSILMDIYFPVDLQKIGWSCKDFEEFGGSSELRKEMIDAGIPITVSVWDEFDKDRSE